MRTRTKLAAATGALSLAIALYAPTDAAADPIPVTAGSNAYAAAANSGTGSLAASLHLSGALGGLLDGIVGPIVTNALNPLVAALQATTNSLVSSTLGASSALTAGNPTYQGTETYSGFPNDTFPSQCPKADGTTPCFSASSTNITSSLVTVAVPVLRGYTQENKAGSKPSYGRAQITNPSITVPFVPTVPGLPAAGTLLTASAVNSYAACPNDGSAPTVGVSAANVQLLGGLVSLSVASNSIASVTVNGHAYTLNSLPATAIAGVNLSTYGSSLKLTIPLTLQQLEVALSLSSSVTSQLDANALANASLTLTVIVGPNSSVTATSAKAWGLGVGVDLSGTLGFDLAGLVGATVPVPTGIGGGNYGNVLDTRLAYSACTSGAATSGATPAVPPALI